MNKTLHLVEIGLISGIVGIIWELLGSIQVSYAILLMLIIIDTVTGIAVAVKLRRFSYRGFRKLVRKILIYSAAILTVRLLEAGIVALVKTTMLSQIMAAFLIITESVSILEKLALLGAPIPSSFISYLLGNIKIPGMDKFVGIKPRGNEKYIADIEEIVTYQIPTFDNQCLRRFLEIRFGVWKNIAIQLDAAIREEDAQKKDLLYYKIMSLVEGGLKEMEDRWSDENITKDCIESFNRIHGPKVDAWLQKVKKVCFSDEEIQIKREQLTDSIVILLYQTIIDAKKLHKKITL